MYTVFSGAFSDEIGQRLLKLVQESAHRIFKELFDNSMPRNPTRFRGSLERVKQWDATVISDQMRFINESHNDFHQVFKHVYVSYVKAMRGGTKVKLRVQVPRLQDFLRQFFIQFSKHRCVADASFFTSNSLLEQRIICMDAVRDSMILFLDNDYVQVEDAEGSVVSGAEKSIAASRAETALDNTGGVTSTRVDNSGGVQDVDAERSRDYDDVQSRVVSNVFEYENDDDQSSIGPDDSVSNVDFAERQHRAIRKFQQIKEDEGEAEHNDDDNSSHTSVSLSSVSLRPKNSSDHSKSRKRDTPSEASSTTASEVMRRGSNAQSNETHFQAAMTARQNEDTLSQLSVEQCNNENATSHKEKKTRRSPVRSYVTSLTAD